MLLSSQHTRDTNVTHVRMKLQPSTTLRKVHNVLHYRPRAPTLLAWFIAAPDASSADTTAAWPKSLAPNSGVVSSVCKYHTSASPILLTLPPPDGPSRTHISTDSTENKSTYSKRKRRPRSREIAPSDMCTMKQRLMSQNPTPTVLAWFTAAPDANSAATTALWPLALAAYRGVAPSSYKHMHGHPSFPIHSEQQCRPGAKETCKTIHCTF